MYKNFLERTQRKKVFINSSHIDQRKAFCRQQISETSCAKKNCVHGDPYNLCLLTEKSWNLYHLMLKKGP